MERRRGKYAAAAGILLAGLAIALVFRRPAELNQPVTVHRPVEPPLRQNFDLAEQLPVETSQLTGRIEEVRTELTSPSTARPVAGATLEQPSAATPPEVAERFQPLGSDMASPPSDPFTTTARTQTPTTTAAAAPRRAVRRHTIRDGDTLAGIAERYLGSALRQDEILALNRDVLSAAEMLPIGKVLRIPADPNDRSEWIAPTPSPTTQLLPPANGAEAPLSSEPPLAPVPPPADLSAVAGETDQAPAGQAPIVALPAAASVGAGQAEGEASGESPDDWRPASPPATLPPVSAP